MNKQFANKIFFSIYFLLPLVFNSCKSENNIEKKEGFPICLQYSEISGEEFNKETADLITNSGFTHLWFLKSENENQRNQIIDFFQANGMQIDFMTHGCELFDRDHSPEISVYDPKYGEQVKKKIEKELDQMKRIENIDHVFPYMDEPFHRKEFLDYSEFSQSEFKTRYGYEMPLSFDQAKKNPKTQLDFLNFQSDIFRDGWLKTQEVVKEFDPRAKVTITHDSHNIFGAGVNSNAQIAIDDVFHWGGDYADLFVYDIYPYLTFDYRYGEPGVYRKPRISQMHYTMAQIRNMTTTYGKKMGFWVGTYNEAWFTRFRGKERASQFWSEREILYTAIANGADYIISPSNYKGNNLPLDQNHWDEFVKGIKIIQKVGSYILQAPKVKSKACFLFPRTQYLLLQEEYYNVGLSFELFLRAFGELDIIHEDQITDEVLNGYEALVMCDVKLLPESTSQNIKKFAENGGIVIADCVPILNEQKQDSQLMTELFGIKNPETYRIKREGQWVPFVNLASKFSFPPTSCITDSPMIFDKLNDSIFNHIYNATIVSPRSNEIVEAKEIMKMESEKSALLTKKTGKGKTYLFGFCLQDTYFQACKTDNDKSLNSLYELVHFVFSEEGINPNIYSSNPDIEVGLRANEKEAYIFVINHESVNTETEITLTNQFSTIKKIIDVEHSKTIGFRNVKGKAKIKTDVSWGKTKLFKILFK